MKLGTISLDGIKIEANASKHTALALEHPDRLEAQVEELLRLADQADNAPRPDPLELKRREQRLALIAAAKEEIESRAHTRFDGRHC
ncbi:hypothetical protein [Thiocapsa bogorovii]|uniref:hypothetical protein n=1 Tax=Thiocapsa bogorovii TaxID=521689 RepID=UPI001E50599E|nr:hypothetical protein [Thiocapsa bogorovii]UHD16227.1 hypothetical protein LT988_23775 [Thiocapsa bogorovii]